VLASPISSFRLSCVLGASARGFSAAAWGTTSSSSGSYRGEKYQMKHGSRVVLLLTERSYCRLTGVKYAPIPGPYILQVLARPTFYNQSLCTCRSICCKSNLRQCVTASPATGDTVWHRAAPCTFTNTCLLHREGHLLSGSFGLQERLGDDVKPALQLHESVASSAVYLCDF